MVQFRVLWQLVQGLLHSVSFLSRGIKQDVGSRWRSKGRVGVFLCVRLLLFSFRVYPEFVGLRVHAWVRPFCAQGTLLWTFLMVMILVYGFAIVGIVPWTPIDVDADWWALWEKHGTCLLKFFEDFPKAASCCFYESWLEYDLMFEK